MAFCSLSSATVFLFSRFFWRAAGFIVTTFPSMFNTCAPKLISISLSWLLTTINAVNPDPQPDLDLDPHHFVDLDPHPHQIKIRIRIRIRIRVKSQIRIRIRIRIK
jgi:hypothetical protein